MKVEVLCCQQIKLTLGRYTTFGNRCPTVLNSFFRKLYDIGQRIRLEKVLLVGSKDFTLIGRPFLPRDQISVEATVVEKTLTHKKVNHWRQIKTNRQRKTQCKFEIAVG